MLFIVRKAILAGVLFLICAVAEANDTPRILHEPLLGVRYDRFAAKFEPLPPHLLASCETLAPRETWYPVWYIYSKAESAEHGTFYVVGGYSVRARPHPPEIPKYDRDDPGVIFNLKEGQCTVFEDAARAMFEPNLAGEIPDEVLRALAEDHAKRLVQALGIKRVRSTRIAISKLPPALREAYSAVLK